MSGTQQGHSASSRFPPDWSVKGGRSVEGEEGARDVFETKGLLWAVKEIRSVAKDSGAAKLRHVQGRM